MPKNVKFIRKVKNKKKCFNQNVLKLLQNVQSDQLNAIPTGACNLS